MSQTPRSLRRLILLGAGFSKPAGLPLSTELLDLVLKELQLFEGKETHLHRAVPGYLDFKQATTGVAPDPIDIEDFAAYLDYRHVFGLLGSDTWSEQGNRDQLLLRWGIGRVLHLLTPERDAIPELYIRFAERLRPRDVVVSFNYDLLLEWSMEQVRVPYRRFPFRFSSVHAGGGTVDSERDAQEITLLKPHGSIDWVTKEPYERKLDYMEQAVAPGIDGRRHAEKNDFLFGDKRCSTTHQLIEGPRPDGDHLSDIHVIDDLNSYYGHQSVGYFHPPLALAPSDAKQLYGTTLRSLWEGLAIAGFGWGGISMIGYSLPPADPYATQVLYELVRGYKTGLEDAGWRIGPMHSIGLVDKRQSKKDSAELLERYRFLPEEYTCMYLNGFDLGALDVVFPSTPIAEPEKGTTST